MYSRLEQHLSYNFKDRQLLTHALTHASYDSTYNNERLEFLGDGLLQSIISDYLYNLHTTHSEGVMSQMRAKLLCNSMHCSMGKFLDLQEFIRFGPGISSLSVQETNIISDAFEAIIGAIWLDTHFSYSILKALCIELYYKAGVLPLNTLVCYKDFKSLLYEHVQKLYAHTTLNVNKIIKIDHVKRGEMYKVTVAINSYVCSAKNRSLKRATYTACKDMYKLINKHNNFI